LTSEFRVKSKKAKVKTKREKETGKAISAILSLSGRVRARLIKFASGGFQA
jgi:hypothetical protein